MPNKKNLRIGVLLVDTVQFLDAAPIDLFGMLSKSYLKSHSFPSSVSSLGLDPVTILYISPSDDDPCLAGLTADAALRVTRSLTSSDCAPGKLDILIIPGPRPSFQISNDIKAFVQGHAAVEKTIVMTICTGIFVAAQAGILHGKTATGTGAFLPELKEKYKDVNWVRRRWAVDGNFWSSGRSLPSSLSNDRDLHDTGTITNGNDMVAAFLKQHYPGTLSESICSAADVGDRGQDFPQSN